MWLDVLCITCRGGGEGIGEVLKLLGLCVVGTGREGGEGMGDVL